MNRQTDSPEQNTTSSGSPASKTVNIGETFGSSDLKAVVRNVTRGQNIRYAEADSDNDFVIVRLVVKNTTGEYEIDLDGFPPIFRAQLVDSQNYNYDLIRSPTATPFAYTRLVPGQVMRGDLAYQIPDDASDLKIQFDFSDDPVMNLNRLAVNLSKESDSIDNLTQNIKVRLHPVGESVAFGGLQAQINSVEFREQDDSRVGIVDVSLTNTSDSEIPRNHIYELQCTDELGHNLSRDTYTSELDLSRTYSTENPLSPGETRRGKVPFTIPVESEQLYCSFNFNEYVDGPKTFWQSVRVQSV
jgi:hypothetical protein